MFFNVAPDKSPVEQHVGAVRRVHRRAVRLQGLFRLHHKGQWLIDDADFFGGILGQCTGVGNHGDHPFAGIAGLPHRQRMALNFWRIEPVHQRIGCRRKLIAGQHIMDAGHGERRRGVDRNDTRGRMLRRQDRHMQQAFERDIRHEMAVAGDETAILADAAIGGNKTEARGIGAHFASTTGLPVPACGALGSGLGVLALRNRSAANSTASMICP